MYSLPVELLDSIAQYLSCSSLASLAQTCSALCPVAHRVLYRSVSASAWSQNLCVIDTLAKKPHVARFVRSFYIAIDSLAPVFLAYYRQLAKAILNMSELTSLTLLVDSSVSWVLKEAFLDRTPSLLELEVDSIPTVFMRNSPLPYLAPTSIPQLQQFIGSSRAAELIVPGRPVSSIHLNGEGLMEDDIPLLARSTVPVIILGAVTNAPPVPFLETLHRHVPHLVYLRLMSTKDIFIAPTAEFYEQVASVLTSFTELNAFEFSGMHWDSQVKQNDGAKRVWQSAPLQIRNHPEDDLLFGSEIFLAY
ncbi:uncharacterized protein BJ212DRAFT_1478526 [Suillus subaureus]|uniref:F-box domain-containing protein n=1 Tax=Suillus subaureus TaxID=48587 RepID=A0A9P7JG62_9AGAM|nr:uncharacterized protein BJ212DRAFT_1478526 [Suillus subaureus]KAG1820413.1 hypothetical protein BJ212DRAFT_1478526 [Suillus subaureus]